MGDLDRIAPRFEVEGEDVVVLRGPVEFYEALKVCFFLSITWGLLLLVGLFLSAGCADGGLVGGRACVPCVELCCGSLFVKRGLLVLVRMGLECLAWLRSAFTMIPQ